MKVLVINAGSSSIKYQLFSMATEAVIAKGLVERIGEAGSRLVQQSDGRKKEVARPIADHGAAFKVIVEALLGDGGAIRAAEEIEAVGHRVVHGAESFTGSVLITASVLDAIRACIPLAPLHNPPNLTGIEAARKLLPDVPHVAVFDTAFHQTMPPVAYVYAIPYALYAEDHIRRYGFHGTSHRYVSERAAEIMGVPLDRFNCITCHLGNGCSMAAIRGGKCVDTSMGLTPLEGLVMGTRSGDLDPAIIFHLANVKGMSFDEINAMLNKASGLIGVSGVSNDMRSLVDAAVGGNKQADLAIDVFAYRIRKYIGSYMAVLGRTDAVILTGGIGENSDAVRDRICRDLDGIGIRYDASKNVGVRGKEVALTTDDSPIRVLVVPTNEELIIARDTAAIAQQKQ
ncbi:MAG: acetate kinase [Planctomycetes bacterium]|nr:acetate kinase [Planctomycetota bacterium]